MRTIRSLGLLAVLAGFFALFVRLGPAAPDTPGIAVALFFGSLGVFRLMSRFESARPAPSRRRSNAGSTSPGVERRAGVG